MTFFVALRACIGSAEAEYTTPGAVRVAPPAASAPPDAATLKLVGTLPRPCGMTYGVSAAVKVNHTRHSLVFPVGLLKSRLVKVTAEVLMSLAVIKGPGN